MMRQKSLPLLFTTLTEEQNLKSSPVAEVEEKGKAANGEESGEVDVESKEKAKEDKASSFGESFDIITNNSAEIDSFLSSSSSRPRRSIPSILLPRDEAAQSENPLLRRHDTSPSLPTPAFLSLALNDLNSRQTLLSPGFDSSSGLLSPVTVIECRRGSTCTSESQTVGGRLSPLEPWLSADDADNPSVVFVCNAQSQTSPPGSLTADAGIQTDDASFSPAGLRPNSRSPSCSSVSSLSSSKHESPTGEELLLFIQSAMHSLMRLYKRTEALLTAVKVSKTSPNSSKQSPLQELDSLLSERSAVTASLRDTQSGVMDAMRRLDDRFRSLAATMGSEERPNTEASSEGPGLRQRLTALEAELRQPHEASTLDGSSLSDSSKELQSMNVEILQSLSQLRRRAFSEGALSDFEIVSDTLDYQDVALQTDDASWDGDVEVEEVKEETALRSEVPETIDKGGKEEGKVEKESKKESQVAAPRSGLTSLSEDPHKKVAIWLSDVAFRSESPAASFLTVGAVRPPIPAAKSDPRLQYLNFLGNSTMASAGSFDEQELTNSSQ